MDMLEKLRSPYSWERIVRERLTEPLHLNFLSLLVAIFGSYRLKIEFDLILRLHNAFGILQAAELARECGFKKTAVYEFGVGNGTGLINMAHIARRVSRLTGVEIAVYGFDTGRGLPAPRDYRDQPDLYHHGEYAMDQAALRRSLPNNAQLILGELAQTLPQFMGRLDPSCPVGYAVIDLDYYSSTVDCLKFFTGPPELYLPQVILYLDDITKPQHNSACGELLAVDEFNAVQPQRIIERDRFLVSRRIFKHAPWIEQIRQLHVLDHPRRNRPNY